MNGDQGHPSCLPIVAVIVVVIVVIVGLSRGTLYYTAVSVQYVYTAGLKYHMHDYEIRQCLHTGIIEKGEILLTPRNIYTSYR